jgi:hypothetical protein
MSFIKLDETHQMQADGLYELEVSVLHLIDMIEVTGRDRWLSIGRTDIEKGFMALRKGITEKFKAKNASLTNE